MSADNQRVIELCKRVTQETDNEKLMGLVRQLNDELEDSAVQKQEEKKAEEKSLRHAS